MLRNLSRLPRLAAAGIALLALLVVVACGSDPTATSAPTVIPPPTATATPVPPPPTATPAPTATPRPTATPVPPTPTPTAMPEPTAMMESGQSLLPEGAQFIVDARPEALLDSLFLGEMMGMFLVDAESMIDDASEAICLDPTDLTYVQMFLPADLLADVAMGMGDAEDPMTMEEAAGLDFGVALHGGFDQSDVMACLADVPEPEGYESAEYRGYEVHLTEDVLGERTALAFAGPGVMLIGTQSAVEAMLDVAAGAAPPASGAAVAALESLGPRHLGIVMEIPPEFMEATEGMMPEQGLLGAMDLTALTAPVNAMSALLNEDSIEIASVSVYDNLLEAAAAKEYSEGLMAMTGVIFAESPELMQLASEIEVSQSGNSVTTRITVSFETLELLMELLESGMMMPSP